MEIVPDGSFEDCSSCGVCGTALGHNVIQKSPVLPNRKSSLAPPKDRNCRIRIFLHKFGEMAFLGHLDLMRMLDMALRRSGLPVSFLGGFHPFLRIQIALALPLGAESHGE